MDQDKVIARLLTLYAEATDEQRANGREWYRRFATGCARIARETGTPLRRVVATAAITSPDAQLSTNLRWTREACATRGAALVGRYPRVMSAKYRPILSGEAAPGATVGGDKVTAFYRAILGDTDAVVLDRHALRAAGHHRDRATPVQYRRIAALYREASARVGETPRDFQAVVWIVLRERGRARLTDIHDLVAPH
jgi:hypothetical protein